MPTLINNKDGSSAIIVGTHVEGDPENSIRVEVPHDPNATGSQRIAHIYEYEERPYPSEEGTIHPMRTQKVVVRTQPVFRCYHKKDDAVSV